MAPSQPTGIDEHPVIRDEFDDVEDEGGGPNIDPKVLLLYGAWRSKFWIGCTATVGALLGLAVGASMPNVYTSNARLDYRPGKAESINAAAAAGIESGDLRHSVPGMVNEELILDDIRVFEKIAVEIGPDKVLATPDPTQYDDEAGVLASMWHRCQKVMIGLVKPGLDGDPASDRAVRSAALSLKSRTTLEAVRGASIFKVAYDGFSKQEAQDTATKIIAAYVERHKDHYSVVDAYTANTERTQLAHEKYNLINEEFRSHTRLCGFVDIQAQKEATIEKISLYETELTRFRGEQKSWAAKIKKTTLQLETIDPYVDEVKPAVMQENPRYSLMYEELLELERQLTLNSNQGSMAQQREKKRSLEKQIQSVQRELDDLDESIEAEPAVVVPKVNELYYATIARIDEGEAEMAGISASIAQTEEALRAALEELSQIGICEDSHTGFDTELVTAKKEWDELRAVTQEQSRMVDLGDEGLANLSVLSPPTLPLGKGGPARIKPLAAGIGAGIFLGLLLAVLRQLMDKNVRYPETVEKSIGVRVLGVVPEASSLRRIRPGHVNVA